MSYTAHYPYGPGAYTTVFYTHPEDISLKVFKDNCEHAWIRNFTACRMNMMEHMNREMMKIPPSEQLNEIKKYVQKRGSDLMSISLSFDDVEHYSNIQSDTVSISSSTIKPNLHTNTISTIHSINNGQLKVPYIARNVQPIFKRKILELCKASEDDLIYIRSNNERIKTEITALFEIIKISRELIKQENIDEIVQSLEELN